MPPLSWRKQYTIWKTLCQKLQLLGQQKQLLTHYLSSAMTKKPLRSSGFATTTREFVCSLRWNLGTQGPSFGACAKVFGLGCCSFSCKLPQNFGLDLSEKCSIECGNLDYPYRLFRMTEPGVCQVESSNSYFCANIFVRSGPRFVFCHFVVNMCSRSKFRGYVKIVTIGSNLDVQGE